jgi:type IV pilus assembly protein PilN
LLRAQDEQRKGAARAMNLSEPLVHLRDLLDALSFEPGDGVVLQQLRHREHETELFATSRGHIASAGWLKRLSAIRGVQGAEVSDLHRSAPRSSAVAAGRVTGPIEFGAHLRWDDPPNKTAHTAGLAAQRPMKSEQSGGAK